VNPDFSRIGYGADSKLGAPIWTGAFHRSV